MPVVTAGLPGCGRDVRLADERLRDVTVRTVTHFGVTLDEDAEPEQVAYVLLRAIRDDFLAATPQEREKALDVQFDVAAANAITAGSQSSLTRNELLYYVVHMWTPTVSHYVHDFETEWEHAKERLRRAAVREANESKLGRREAQLVMEVKDPGGDPNASALLVVSLVEDNDYWRVMRLGFSPSARAFRSRTAAGNG